MEPKHKEMDGLLTFWPKVVSNCSSVFRGGSFVPKDISINFNQTGYCNVLLQRLVNQRRKEPCRWLTNYTNRRHICQQRHSQREMTRQQTSIQFSSVDPHASSNDSGYLSSIIAGWHDQFLATHSHLQPERETFLGASQRSVLCLVLVYPLTDCGGGDGGGGSWSVALHKTYFPVSPSASR